MDLEVSVKVLLKSRLLIVLYLQLFNQPVPQLPQDQASQSTHKTKTPQSQRNDMPNFEQQNPLELPQGSPLSLIMSSTPSLEQPDDQQQTTSMESFKNPDTVGNHIAASYLSSGTPSANACVMDPDLLQWRIEQRDVGNQDWGLGSMDYPHEDFQHHMSGNFASSGSELV